MKIFGLIFLILVAFSYIVLGQNNKIISLIISQCQENERICDTQKIVRYNFLNGELKDKETLLSISTDEIRFDLGGNFIFRNRYIITDSGDVFDLKTKSIVYKSRGELLEIIDNKIITEVNRVDDEGFYSFDLRTNILKKIRQLKGFPETNLSKFSPNKKIFATWVRNGFQKSKFIFYQIDGNLNLKKIKEVVGDFTASCSVRCSDSMKVGFVWVNDQKILTQKSNGKLVTVDLNGKIENITDLKINEVPDSLPFFEKDEFGNLIYYCNGAYYQINLKDKTFTKDKLGLGNGFESQDEDGFWVKYLYQGKQIGRLWSSSAMTYKDFLVIDYAKEGKNLGYPDGIKIWNSIKKDWIALEVNWGVRIIGWTVE